MKKSATKTFGILTSGGDCAGLNAAIRGVVKPALEVYDMNAIGIFNGYQGLINGDIKPLKREDVSGILTLGGTILGTSREKPFKNSKDSGVEIDKVGAIKETYKKYGLDCIVVLGGNGSQKTAAMLKKEGLNVVGLPKTIDNDIFGTDTTFGFQSAVDVATDAVDRMHSTACSHNRVMVIEVMGHYVGWLALYAGVAGGGDVILIPEIPYDIKNIKKHLNDRAKSGKTFSVVVTAEGALSCDEAKLSREELKKKRKNEKIPKAYTIAKEIQESTGMDVRVSVLGYQQRGGAPSSYDRVIATQLGSAAAQMLYKGDYGNLVSIKNGEICAVPLEKVAGKLKTVPEDHRLISDARMVGTCFGDK